MTWWGCWFICFETELDPQTLQSVIIGYDAHGQGFLGGTVVASGSIEVTERRKLQST